MQFRTIVTPEKPTFEITYDTRLFSIGSCFADNMAEKLKRYKFNIVSNPFDVLYNPASIFQSLKQITGGHVFQPEDLFEYQGQWHSFAHHSKFSDKNKDEVLNQINSRIEFAGHQLSDAGILIITFGTAWVYLLRNENKLVANCHKLPHEKFERRLLEVEAIVSEFGETLNTIKKRNPGIKVVLSVSPIRHLKDGAAMNNRSKARLIEAVHSIIDNNEGVYYFPAYEIVMDELRDYRFYEENMTHPNRVAINYIWENFISSFMDSKTKALMNKVEKISRAFGHKILFPESKQTRAFAEKQLGEISSLHQHFADLDFTVETTYFKSLL
jgi:GSCFA family